jgi:cytidylate kinase
MSGGPEIAATEPLMCVNVCGGRRDRLKFYEFRCINRRGVPAEMNIPATRIRRLQISIAGSAGSGKTTVGQSLATELAYHYHSTGSRQRETARSLGLTTLQLNVVAENTPGIDETIDSDLRSLAGLEHIVVDSRMAWLFLSDSFRVCLIVSAEEAARRIIHDGRREAERYVSLNAATRAVEARALSERKRFFNTYGVEIASFRNFDYVIDTELLDAAQVVEYILVGYKLWLSKLHFAKALVSPSILFPSRVTEASEALEIEGMAENIERLGVTPFEAPTALFYMGKHIIVKGHRNVRAAIKAGVAAVPVKYVNDIGILNRGALTTEEFVRLFVNRTTLLDWEQACGIKLPHPPPSRRANDA